MNDPETNEFLKPVNKSRLHEEIIEQLLGRMLTREFKVGQKTPTERELAENFAVNRATVREALKKLEVFGLVEIRHGDGIYVKDYLDSGNLELFKIILRVDHSHEFEYLSNMIEIRQVLVPVMTARAAQNRTSEDLAAMKRIIDIPEEELNLMEKDLKFNQRIARASGNLFFLFIQNFFQEMFREYGWSYFNNPENLIRSRRYHRDMYDLLLNKDAEGASEYSYRIMSFAGQQVFDYYRSALEHANEKE